MKKRTTIKPAQPKPSSPRPSSKPGQTQNPTRHNESIKIRRSVGPSGSPNK